MKHSRTTRSSVLMGKRCIGLHVCILLLVSSCWQEQHHDIIPPPQPNYLVWGKVFNSADRSPVSGAVVLLGTEIDTTDTSGTYLFEQIMGSYQPYGISVTKPHFEIYSGTVTVGYGIDTVEVDDISLGKIYYHLDQYKTGGWKSFSPQGVVWRGSNLWSADSMAGAIFAHNYDSYLSVAEKHSLPHYPIPKGEFYISPLGLEWHRNYVITYDDQKDVLYELILTAGDTAIINASYGLPAEVTSTGDLWDLTWDGRRLWSCSPGFYEVFYSLSKKQEDDVIYRHAGDLSVAATFPTVEIDEGIVNPTGIAWDGEKFWLNSHGNHRLYMLDENLGVLGYYVLEEEIWSRAPYQICWGNGYLWGCYRDTEPAIHSVGGPKQYIYKFGKPYP